MEEQLNHYQNKLSYEIDAWDLKVILEAKDNVMVVEVWIGGSVTVTRPQSMRLQLLQAQSLAAVPRRRGCGQIWQTSVNRCRYCGIEGR